MVGALDVMCFFFSSRRRHTRFDCDWSSDVCSSDLGRLGFGLVLIVAFSVGLAAVLIAIGLLVLHARRFMARWRGEGVLLTRWLPLTSSVAITGLGLAIAAPALRTAGILHGRL